jgi:TolA-binding protein
MNRSLFLGIVAAAVLGGAACAQPVEAEITYFHRTKKAQDTVKGTIVEESPGMIAYRISNRVEKLPAGDVIEVEYQPPSALLKADLRKALRLEDEVEKAPDAAARKAAAQKAIAGFNELLPKLTDSRYAQRHIAYKVARLTARLAEDDPAEREQAIAALGQFLKEHGGGWQVSRAARLLAQLQLEKGDAAGAQKTFELLASKPDIPKETRREYQLLAVRALMRTGNHAEARKLLAAVQVLLPADDAALRTRADIYAAGCQAAAGDVAGAEKQLKAVLAGEAEPALKALACNTLGDVYLKAGRSEEAFWRFLMVDTLYTQDPEEQARALYHLAQLFDKVKKDPARAQECRERLLKERQFAGAEYRHLALKEK